MKEGFFEGRGISYRINEFRAGRQTLVWIHGLSGSASAWYPYERAFGDRYNILTFDLRGHGLSARPRHYHEYSIEILVEDVRALLQELHIESCVLVSHSFGTLVALELANVHPELVSSLILLSPTAYLTKTRWYHLIRLLRGPLRVLARILPFHTAKRGRVDYRMFSFTGDWDLRRIVRDVGNTTIHAYLYCLLQAYAHTSDAEWRNIQVPTRIIHGTKDTYIPAAHAKQLSSDIRGSELVLLAGANHIIVLNNVSDVTEHIRQFLDLR